MIQLNDIEAAHPSSRPFVIHQDTDLTGTATGDDEVRSYCALPSTEASRYRLDRADHNQIFQFRWTLNGVTGMTYCLDKFADGPYNDVPYESAPFETLFPNATERQKQMLAWILANAYPAVSAGETFALTGTDPQASPILDDNDAYAVVQIAIWVLLGQIAPDEVYFLNCSSDTQHPKSVRLRAAVLRLIELAGSFADSVASPAPPTPASHLCCCKKSLIDCCNTGRVPSTANTPYLVFKGCPDELRTVCGRILIGPFTLQSNFIGQPNIEIEPLCVCQEGFSSAFMDFCGNIIENPSIGQEFYIAVRTIRDYICFAVKASFKGTITRVITMRPTSTALNYQPVGSSLEDENITVNASICICTTVAKDSSSEMCYPGGLRIDNYVNNNVNNNVNSNSNNNMNQDSGIGSNSSCIWIYPPYCFIPGMPYPPYPPYPPMPPYPPEPPKPPYPPEPPKPPCCPPEPPCCPPEPPCCPPKPPCCPPEPPCCPPEPPCCPPKPPCCPPKPPYHHS